MSKTVSSSSTKDAAAPVERLAYNRKATAQLLSVAPITLDRIVARGLIRPSRATRRPLFAKTEIERFLRETAEVIEP